MNTARATPPTPSSSTICIRIGRGRETLLGASDLATLLLHADADFIAVQGEREGFGSFVGRVVIDLSGAPAENFADVGCLSYGQRIMGRQVAEGF